MTNYFFNLNLTKQNRYIDEE